MSDQNFFESPFRGIPLKDQVKNPNIIVGEYSYYSGYYHGVPFDECVHYLDSKRCCLSQPEHRSLRMSLLTQLLEAIP
jgi:hypothetical protein